MTQPSHAARNIELKVRYAGLDRARDVVRQMGARHDVTMRQVDTYFHVRQGRLKLREIEAVEPAGAPPRAELIAYDRRDTSEFRDSVYHVTPVPEPAVMKRALASTCGTRGAVVKHREVWLYHNVRVHLDRVEGLGEFIEFEAVMTAGETDGLSRARLAELHERLGMREGDHERGSYSDLMGL